MFSVSERRACRVVGQCRGTQQYVPIKADDEESLRTRIVALTREYGRYGSRRITALLHQEGWRVNHKRVERLGGDRRGSRCRRSSRSEADSG